MTTENSTDTCAITINNQALNLILTLNLTLTLTLILLFTACNSEHSIKYSHMSYRPTYPEKFIRDNVVRAVARNFIFFGGEVRYGVQTNEWPKATSVARGHERGWGKMYDILL